MVAKQSDIQQETRTIDYMQRKVRHHALRPADQAGCPDGDTLTPIDEAVIQKTGYTPEDFLEAPLKPPQPKRACRPNKAQFVSISLSLILAIVGVVLWPIMGLVVSIACLGAASVFIAVSTLIRM